MEWDGTEWDGMGWDGMGQMEWTGLDWTGLEQNISRLEDNRTLNVRKYFSLSAWD